MSSSNVTLYITKIYPSKNFAIDSISTYLTSCSKIILTNFQYIKHALNVEIKINREQANLEYLYGNNYNYCSIQNSITDETTKMVYYFITDKKWISSSCIKLTLVMDTINTFTLGTDYKLDDKTLVNRQHFDRYVKSFELGGEFVGQIYDSEEDLPRGVQLVIADNIEYYQGTIGQYNSGNYFTLIQYNPDGSYANSYQVDCIDFAFDANGTYFEIFDGTTSQDKVYEHAVTGYYCVILNSDTVVTGPNEDMNENIMGYFINRMLRKIHVPSESINPILYGSEKEIVQGDTNNWYLIYYGSTLRAYLTTDLGFTATIDGDQVITNTDLVAGRYYYVLPDENNNRVNIKLADGTYVSAYLLPAGEWGREQTVTCYYLDGSDIKVIVYKYQDIGLGFYYVSSSQTYTTSSVTIESNNDVYVRELSTLTHNTATIRGGTQSTINIVTSTQEVRAFNTLDRYSSDLYKIIKLPYCPVSSFKGWKYDSVNLKMIYLDNLDTLFSNTLTPTYNPLEELTDVIDITDTAKDQTRESKLYHSDYYQPKFIYDSFSFIFNLELVNTSSYTYSTTMDIVFNMTNTINTRFMFTFTSYVTDGYSLSDYDNVLVVARNNEISIFTSNYVDYLRNGYNYDVKNKQRQDAFQWASLGIGTATSAATYGIAGGGLSGGLTLAGSTINQIMGAINSTMGSEMAIRSKLFQLSQQHASVSGSDDVDLMTDYTGNKAKYMIYQASERMKKVLYDLFFYTGYIDGTMHVPDMTSRTRFNFVMCDPVINNLVNLSEELIDDLTTRYNTGVTFIHYYNSDWDFEQTYENWEVSLYE